MKMMRVTGTWIPISCHFWAEDQGLLPDSQSHPPHRFAPCFLSWMPFFIKRHTRDTRDPLEGTLLLSRPQDGEPDFPADTHHININSIYTSYIVRPFFSYFVSRVASQ